AHSTRKKGPPRSDAGADQRRNLVISRSAPTGGRGSTGPSTAFRISAIETRHAAVEQDRGRRIALAAELRTLREALLGEGVLLPAAGLELRALLGDQLLLLGRQRGRLQQADLRQVPLDDMAELRDDRGHELAARLPVAAARVEHGLQLVDEERDVTALSEHGRHDARQRNDPLVVIEVLRVDEDLERPPLLVRRALVQHDVVD